MKFVSRDETLTNSCRDVPCICGVVGVWIMLRDSEGTGRAVECVACGTIVRAGTALRAALARARKA